MKDNIRGTIQKVGIALIASLLLVTAVLAQQTRSAAHSPDWTNKVIEEKIWKLLEDNKSVFVTLPEPDFRALGEGFDLPDGGKTVTDLAMSAPGGAFELRNPLLNNRLVMQGLKNLILKNTQGDILLIGHSTSGELSMLSYEDPELATRLKGRYLGWGSGGPARVVLTRTIKSPAISAGGTGDEGGGGQKRPLEMLTRRNTAAYSRGYSWFLNPLYEPGMSIANIADTWLNAEARRRPQFKQQIQDLEHGAAIDQKGWIEAQILGLLKKTENPWGVNFEDVDKDLYSTHFTRMDGYKKMVWTVAHFDRNHWLPEDPMHALEVYVANEYRAVNPDAQIRLIVWDPPMTHYGHLELPKQLAAADYSVVRWLVK